MAENITLAPVSSFTNDSSAVATVNANSTLITTAFVDCLSRAGTVPNQMQSNLDMNNNQILNLPAPATINSPARLIDVVSNPTLTIVNPVLNYINIKSAPYNAVGNGTADDTVAIQSAVTAAGAGGGFVYIPAGTYLVTSTITIGNSGVYIKGSGIFSTIIKVVNQSTDVFLFHNVSSFLYGGISDLTIAGFGSSTAGYAIEANNVGAVTFTNIRITGAFAGINVNQGSQGGFRATNVDMDTMVSDCFVVSATNTAVFDNCSCFNNTSGGGAGFHLINGAGIIITNSFVDQQKWALLINPGNGQVVVDVWCSNLDLDASSNSGIFIDTSTTTGIVRDIYFSNVRTGFANNGAFTAGQGVEIAGSGSKGIVFLGGEDVRNTQTGFYIHGGTNIRVVNRLVMGNSVAGAANFNGINIDGGDKITIIGGSSGVYTDGGANNQNFGVAVQSGFSGSLLVEGVDLSGNVNPYISASSSANIKVLNCPGYNPVGVTGAATIGASPATITAGSSPETHYLNQSATNTATVAKGGQQILTLVGATTYHPIDLGPNESYVVTWTTTAPTYTKDVH